MRRSIFYRRWLRHKKIAFDTSFLIPILEDSSRDDHRYTRILDLIERRKINLITSTITLLEILVHPYRKKSSDAVNRYYGYLTHQSRLELSPVSAEIADRAAELRARYGFKTPDAIQIATALIGKATLLFYIL